MATAQSQLLPDSAVKDLRTTDDTPQGLALVIERLAANPQVDVAKLEKIIELQERILRHQAESAFNAAFATMQAEIPTIIERASTDKTSYAPLEDIVSPLRPILVKHGFSISHQTEWPAAGQVKVIGILTHRDGHARRSEFLSGADNTGSKNAIQALASTVSYGRRYTVKDLLCIVTKGEDDDAEGSTKADQPEAPKGYDAWFSTLEGVSDGGMKDFAAAWNKSPEAFRMFLSKTAPKVLANLRNKASKVRV
jgi:hypothetical protein